MKHRWMLIQRLKETRNLVGNFLIINLSHTTTPVMKTKYSSLACLSILFLFFFQTGCDREQIPGEIGSQQLRSIEFPNQDSRVDFIYDDQDTLLRMEGIRPGEEENAQEFTYRLGLIRDIQNWRITSPAEEFISHQLTWFRFSDGRPSSVTVKPSYLGYYNYEDNYWLHFPSPGKFPDSLTYHSRPSEMGLVFEWNTQQNQLTATEKKRIFTTQLGWHYAPTDTTYLLTFDEAINPLQYLTVVKNPTTLLASMSSTNLIQVDTIFPDLSVNSFVKTIEYDNQNRPIVISYEQDGEMIREVWTYRR